VSTRKSAAAMIVAGALLQTTLIASAGCSALIARIRDGANCHSEHHLPTENYSVVHVGGQVHEPRQLAVDVDGLTLRRALMAAGGAREMAVAASRVTADPERVVKLQRFTAVQRQLGKLDINARVHAQLPDLPDEVVPLTSEEVEAEVAKTTAIAEGLQKELADLLGIQRLNALASASRAAGENHEKLALFDNEIVRRAFPDWRQEDIEDALRVETENEKDVMNELLGSDATTLGLASVRSEFLVTLERLSVMPPITYYFPYDMAVAGPVGEIPLVDGDAVNVVDIRDTELNPQAAGIVRGLKNIAIDGYVNAPGAKSLATMGAVPGQGSPSINDARSVWMVVRPSVTGKSQTIFVLPERLLEPNGAAADAPTVEGDLYNYVILPQIPIVTEALLVQTIEMRKRHYLDKLATLKEKKQQHIEKVHRHFERFRNH